MKKIIWQSGAAVLAVVVLYGMWWVGAHDPAPLEGEVAAKLRDAGATLYIVSDDPLSQQQVQQFGRFSTVVPTVDCKAQTTVCDTLQLEEMPTMIISKANIEVPGLQTPAEIKKLLQSLELW